MIRKGDEYILSNGCKLYRADKKTVEAYWKWICDLSKNDNPFLNNNGHKDEVQPNRGDKMFFLSPADSGISDRKCKVPLGYKILIPSLCVVATGATKEGGEKPNAKLEDLIRLNNVDQRCIEFRSVEIDKEQIPEEFLKECRYSSREEEFPVHFPKDHPIFNATSGDCKAVADGVYLILECPSESDKSELKIHFKGTIDLKLKSEGEESLETTNYTEDVTYTLARKAD